MKEAKQHKAMHRCGTCAKTIKLRHDAVNVACTAHLTVIPADHVVDCGEYEPAADRDAEPVPAQKEPPASPEDSPKAP